MSLTAGAVTGGIASLVGTAGEAVVSVIKIVALVGFNAIFGLAILALVGQLEQVVLTSVMGEVFGIIGCCLPFHANVVFGTLLLVLNGVAAFSVAKKSWELTTGTIGKVH